MKNKHTPHILSSIRNDVLFYLKKPHCMTHRRCLCGLTAEHKPDGENSHPKPLFSFFFFLSKVSIFKYVNWRANDLVCLWMSNLTKYLQTT